ncbi:MULTISPECIES: L-rhamnonate dehydratase [unclassified Nonomuraea]|uniref:L-rhamnonate dehydratase n=1 Tax=unclassified Nonomuraea TaxID=2593643 RepID=UPI0033E076CD
MDRITDVRVFVADYVNLPPAAADPGDGEALRQWKRRKVASPMSQHADFRDDRMAAIGPDSQQTVVVQVESASGHVGLGTTNGGLVVATLAALHLACLVRGQSAFDHERLWDRMFNSTLHYGRKGLALHAISAVDLAIWDLHGRITQTPVHTLLGGAVHDGVELYATGPRPEAARRLGFRGAKIPLTYAPVEGEDGFRANVSIAEQARQAAGPDFPLMYDCWMSLDVDYAARLAHAVAPLGFDWIEEPLRPDDYAAHRRLRDRLPAPMALASGEHEYTAAGFGLLCESGVDVVQPDPNWCGGLTELRRISTVARAHGVRLVPHTGGHYAYHFIATRPEPPLAEFGMFVGDCDWLVPQHPLCTGETFPVDGRVRLGDAPGFGLELDPSVPLRRVA